MGKIMTLEFYRSTFVRANYRCVYYGREMLGALRKYIQMKRAVGEQRHKGAQLQYIYYLNNDKALVEDALLSVTKKS